ncbi:hypothetical protein [Actinocrispum sp. NPDC049592]|uniref:hypothetical protein n=1 Tax=Actinocrispum sp. NPDC049592 TaxID=3154835 RepID=UPI0034487D5D
MNKLVRPHDTATETHTAIARQLLADATARLLDPLGTLFDPAIIEPLRRQLRGDSEMWAAQVTGPDERLAGVTARRIIAAIYSDGGIFAPPRGWWQSPFGALVARRFGHPTADVVSLSVASAMLGITRQGAHDLLKRGKLRRDGEDGGILVSSVQDRLSVPVSPR